MIAYSYYCLDIVHIGHLLMMQNAKALVGSRGQLIVGILTDQAVMERKPRPLLPFRERLELAKAIRYVDLAVPQETYSPLPNARDIRPDILVESASHTPRAIREARQVMKELGGKVVVLPYYPEQSSSQIKTTIREEKCAGESQSQSSVSPDAPDSDSTNG